MATSEAQENASLSTSYRLMGIFMRGSNQDRRGNMTVEGFEIREYNQWLCVCIYIYTYIYIHCILYNTRLASKNMGSYNISHVSACGCDPSRPGN